VALQNGALEILMTIVPSGNHGQISQLVGAEA